MGISYQKKRQTPKRGPEVQILSGTPQQRCKPFSGLAAFFASPSPGDFHFRYRETFMRRYQSGNSENPE